jgi:hypothetical protein
MDFALRIGPELADPLGPVQVGEHQDMEQLGAGSGTERVEALLWSAFQLIGVMTAGYAVKPSARVSDTPGLN